MNKKIIFGTFIAIFVISVLTFTNQNKEKEKYPIKVAILDSGVDKSHKDFSGITFESYNAISNNTTEVIDDNGHGTAVASLIVKYLSKEQAESTVFYDIKILNKDGSGSPNSAVKGLKWAIEQDVDIINFSAGYQTEHKELRNLIEEAIDMGIIVIASAGNNLGFDVDYPAKLQNVISVGSISQDKKRSITSSIGKVDFVTVGENIKVAQVGTGYRKESGSSLATAKVTSFVLKGLHEENDLIKNPHKITKYLENAAYDLGDTGQDMIFGKGYIEIDGGK